MTFLSEKFCILEKYQTCYNTIKYHRSFFSRNAPAARQVVGAGPKKIVRRRGKKPALAWFSLPPRPLRAHGLRKIARIPFSQERVRVCPAIHPLLKLRRRLSCRRCSRSTRAGGADGRLRYVRWSGSWGQRPRRLCRCGRRAGGSSSSAATPPSSPFLPS